MAHVHSHPEDKFRDAQLDMHLEPIGKVRSLFDEAADVTELEPEVLRRPGKWMKCGDTPFEVYRESK